MNPIGPINDNPAESVSFPGDTPYGTAYARRLDEIRSVKPEDLVPVNLDVHQVVTTILGALPEILALRGELARMVHIDQHLVDGLEDYAMATAEAAARYATALAPAEDLTGLYEEALRLRETFRLDTAALSNRGLIPLERLAGFQGHVGYKNVAFDLLRYTTLVMSCWPSLEGRASFTVEEVLEAKRLAERLIEAVGHREQAPSILAEASLIRQQALTLLLRAYDEVRRGLSFLRWREGDADTVAPSLYAGRGRRARQPGDGAPETPPASPTPNTPPAADTAPEGETPLLGP